MTRIVGLLVLSSFLVSAVAGAQEVQDATIADAEAHQVVLDNEHVRVIRALAAPGHTSPMHSHPPILVISLGTGRARITAPDGTQQMLDLHPGMLFWSDGMEHSWELLAGEVNVIGVEVKAANAAAPE